MGSQTHCSKNAPLLKEGKGQGKTKGNGKGNKGGKGNKNKPRGAAAAADAAVRRVETAQDRETQTDLGAEDHVALVRAKENVEEDLAVAGGLERRPLMLPVPDLRLRRLLLPGDGHIHIVDNQPNPFVVPLLQL